MSLTNRIVDKACHKQQQRRAHGEYQKAINSGALVRPTECSDCGANCVPHGHHDDYSRPLEVRWLCAKCHAAIPRMCFSPSVQYIDRRTQKPSTMRSLADWPYYHTGSDLDGKRRFTLR